MARPILVLKQGKEKYSHNDQNLELFSKWMKCNWCETILKHHFSGKAHNFVSLAIIQIVLWAI